MTHLKTRIELYQEDCLLGMKRYPDKYFDSIVTDPPYELGFMGKSWDKTGIAYKVDMWKECLRVLKPGGHLLSFGGSRTYHRMACAIEDAGFEIRDQIMWIYSQGFPKSLNIGKAVDKLQGNEREDIGKNPNARETLGTIQICKKNGSGRLTQGTSEWEGWGTALKPAHEPICLARKPLSEKTVAKNVLRWGIGGINIDGCRIEGEPWKLGTQTDIRGGGLCSKRPSDGHILAKNIESNPKGRFPANLIHDGSKEVMVRFPDSKGQQGDLIGHNKDRQSPSGCYGKMSSALDHLKRNDFGSASRFFYCAKASKAERDAGLHGRLGRNHHPTVKPIALMEYLVKLITPPSGTVLDPFMGSGSTGIACIKLGYGFVGIEDDKDYFEIGKARLEEHKKQLRIFDL